MKLWVWFVAVPIWIAALALLISSVGLTLKGFTRYRQEDWPESTDLFYRSANRNLAAALLIMGSAFVVLVFQ